MEEFKLVVYIFWLRCQLFVLRIQYWKTMVELEEARKRASEEKEMS